ncbi:PP2C family protein-serine/threonine phosphatase [Schlesneria sp.]|uniref:PP2C family protein-serine/threonine phosphatase n=1 Tax=Schlesneria sp. TaxID=2762018 RepID=UPI002EF8275F
MTGEFTSVPTPNSIRRLNQIMETMRELSLQTDPQAMVREYYERMRQVNPQIDRRLAMSRRELSYPDFLITRYSEWEDDIDPWKEPERLPLLSGGILAELIYGNEPRIINNLNVSPDDPAYEYLEGQHSLQAIPLLDQGLSLNMSLHMRRVPNGFSYENLPESVWLANLFGRATSTLVLAERLKEAYEEIDRELKAVARIQRSLLPIKLPQIPRMKLAASYQTARRAGGDYYDFFPLGDGLWGLLIADVSGHGTPAAVMMAVMHSIAHTFPGSTITPGAMLNYLNDRLCQHYVGNTGTFVTAFYAIFDPQTLRLTYSSAGHNPPRLRRGDSGKISSLIHAQHFPLGVMHSFRAVEAAIDLRPGDQLILYTDGIVEAAGPDQELYSLSRLDHEISNTSLDPEQTVQTLLNSVAEFSCGTAASDDRTLVVGTIV